MDGARVEDALKRPPWLRLYREVASDRKVQRLAGDVFKFWVN
jgi:hypothetical protein